MTPSNAQNNTKYIAVQDAITSAISTQYTTSVEVRPMELGPMKLDLSWHYVQISLLRDTPGTLVLGASKTTLTKFAQRFLPSEVRLDDEWLVDLLCETLNVIAGQLKTLLKDTPYHFRLTTPCVISSNDFCNTEKAWYEVLTGEGPLVLGASF